MLATPENCPFCLPELARVFHDDGMVLGLWDGFPVSPGHALLVPRRHVATWFEATADERAALANATEIARRAIERDHRPDGYNVGINAGAAAGQTVFHLHMHVIPRYHGDVPDPRGGVRHVIPAKGFYSADDPVAGASRIVESVNAYDQAVRPTTREECDIAAFGQRLLQLLAETKKVATYKYAVLLGLIDLCLELSSTDGTAPDVITTDQLARNVLALYWPQATPFAGYRSWSGVLKQNPSGQAEILTDIHRFRTDAVGDPSASLYRAQRIAPRAYRLLLRKVEKKLIEMPLPRLQTIGTSELRFLYDIAWDETVSLGDINKPGFDNRIRLRPGVGAGLVQLSGLLRPLVQRGWAQLVAGFNPDATDEVRLQEFLFGAQRISLDPVRAPLREFQNDRCFYCDDRLADIVDVDHFLPWARYPDNGLDNLVVAHPKCNGAKRDFLAAAEHVSRWRDRFDAASDLATIAERTEWERAPERSRNVTRAIYFQLPAEVQLWRHGKEFVDVGTQRIDLRWALTR